MQILLNDAENGDLAIERGKTYVVAVSASSASSNMTCRVLESTGGVVGAVAGEEGTSAVLWWMCMAETKLSQVEM
jgi:hypothetical protein